MHQYFVSYVLTKTAPQGPQHVFTSATLTLGGLMTAEALKQIQASLADTMPDMKVTILSWQRFEG